MQYIIFILRSNLCSNWDQFENDDSFMSKIEHRMTIMMVWLNSPYLYNRLKGIHLKRVVSAVLILSYVIESIFNIKELLIGGSS